MSQFGNGHGNISKKKELLKIYIVIILNNERFAALSIPGHDL